MKKIRLGKDINIEWTIDVEGIDTMNLSIELVGPKTKLVVDTFTVEENTISFSLKANTFTALGDYAFILYKDKDADGQSLLDSANAFTLVGNTACETGCGILDNPTVKLYSGSICKKK